MTRTPIDQLQEGQSIDQSFRIGDKQLRVNRDGGKYLFLKLADRTGVIVAMMWNSDEKAFESIERGGYVHIQGRTQVHKGQLQAIVTEIENLSTNDVDLAEFDRFDAAEASKNLETLKDILFTLSNDDLRELCETYFDDDEFVSGFRGAAAAVSNHHAYPGGLLRHTLDLVQMCELIGPRYPRINVELLIVGAFLHDTGKILEIRGDGDLSYTDRGQLVGHIVIGIDCLGEMIRRLDQDRLDRDQSLFDGDLKLQLEHLIASHHGLLEYGSPRIPHTLEAVALHHIDNLDAKLSAMNHIIETDVSADPTWTNYNPSIGRKLWKAKT